MEHFFNLIFQLVTASVYVVFLYSIVVFAWSKNEIAGVISIPLVFGTHLAIVSGNWTAIPIVIVGFAGALFLFFAMIDK